MRIQCVSEVVKTDILTPATQGGGGLATCQDQDHMGNARGKKVPLHMAFCLSWHLAIGRDGLPGLTIGLAILRNNH